MIFLMQFGINKHSSFFKDCKVHSPCGFVQFFVVYEKFTCAHLFQTVLEIIWLTYTNSPFRTLNVSFTAMMEAQIQYKH